MVRSKPERTLLEKSGSMKKAFVLSGDIVD